METVLSPNIEVKKAETKQELNEICRFRYSVYVEEMGKSFSFADHDNKILTDELDEDATIFYVRSEEEIICTLRINFLNKGNISEFYKTCYALSRFSELGADKITFTSRLMLAPKWRNSLILARFLNYCYDYLRQIDTKIDFCYCAPHLVSLYEQLGYRQYKDNIIDPDVGYRVPLLLILDDINHLQSVRSPFHRMALKWDNRNDVLEWFIREFNPQTQYINRPAMQSEDFWKYLSLKIHNENVPLFKNMTDEEVQSFLGKSTVIKCKPKDQIVRFGDAGKEMFIILSGAAEVKRTINENEFSLMTLGVGDIFGELTFLDHSPRSADVNALNEMELLVLTQTFFEKIISTMPEISTKVLLNLSLILCERLKFRTQCWEDALLTLTKNGDNHKEDFNG